MKTESEQKTKGHCNQCGGDRWHDVLYSLESQTSGQVTKYELLKCAGCDEIKLRKTSLDSEDLDLFLEVLPEITYYPPSTIRPPPSWFSSLMLDLLTGDVTVEYDLLVEIYAALHNNAVALAAMGIRALLEAVMISKVGDNRSFGANLTAMQSKGLISKLDLEHLSHVLEVGHAAIHRGHLPKIADVVSALDISETLVKRLYIDKHAVDSINKSTPKRPK